MSFIFTFIGVMAALDAVWWWMSARLTKSKALRFAIALFMGAHVSWTVVFAPLVILAVAVLGYAIALWLAPLAATT